jgi:hypothetical protein
MVEELKGEGHAAYLLEPSSPSSGRYQVRVGRYSTLAEADRSARELEKRLGWQLRIMSAPRPGYGR